MTARNAANHRLVRRDREAARPCGGPCRYPQELTFTDTRRNEGILLKVSHSNHQPILRLDRGKNEEIPEGRNTPIMVDDQVMAADFMKIAVNVIRGEIDGPNQISDVLRGWFGPMAGEPGTDFYVELWMDGSAWRLSPAYRHQAQGTMLAQ